MGLYLLNTSVDMADPYPEYISEDLSFNDQESIIEIVVEKILGYEDAFKEYDDNDTEDHNKNPNIKVNLISHHVADFTVRESLIERETKKFSNYKSRLYNGFQKLESPPPKI